MTEFISALQEIRQLPPELHLLCPRRGADDQDRYEDDPMPIELGPRERRERIERIADAEKRRKKFITSLQILAYDGPESEQYQRLIWDRLDDALGKCDICIREYYVGKLWLLETLRADYEEEDIKNFFNIFDRRDVARICEGLSGAVKTLRPLPAHQQGFAALQQSYLHAVFESLSCEAFLKDEAKLQQYFDEPFQLLQSRKPLKVSVYLPAVTQFLFHSDERRQKWAVSTWQRIGRPPSDFEWNWAIKDTLQQQLQHATNSTAITKLWSAFEIIVNALDESQITHKVFDLVPNIGIASLDHLAKQTPAIPFILSTLTSIFKKAPQAYWQAMGSISSVTVIEQIFASPNFNKILQDVIKQSGTQIVKLLTWISPFLLSLKPATRPPACRALVTQLLERRNTDYMSTGAKQACYDHAVQVLLQTIRTFSDDPNARQAVKRVVVSDTLDVISDRIEDVLNWDDLGFVESTYADMETQALDLVKNSLALECQCLKADFETLSKGESLSHGSSSYSPDIWEAVIKQLNEDDVKLSSAALLGTMALPGLEPFRASDPKTLSKEKQSYNLIFEKLTGMVSLLVSKLSEFRPEHLDELFKTQDTSMSLVASLYSADLSTYSAAIELVKNISGQSGRREAIGHLLQAFLATTMYSICWACQRTYKMKTFGSVPRLLKTGMEILDVLCNSQTGILRNMRLENRDAKAVETYWSYQWSALRVVFHQTERWSLEVHDKPLMAEVCRDAMQYAEALFEQYDVFASALLVSKRGLAEEVTSQLLDSSDSDHGSPGKTLDSMAKWLRLRDQYLADTLVKLITKMLHKFASTETVLAPEGLQYVEKVATGSTVKTILSQQQKALLVRALEAYLRKPLAVQPEQAVKKKQSLLLDWASSGAGERAGSSTPVSAAQSNDEFGDSDIADSDFYELSGRAIESQKARSKVNEVDKRRLEALKTRPTPDIFKSRSAKKEADSKAFIENRRRETEAAKARAREAAAKLRGRLGVGEQTKEAGSGISGIGVKGKDHVSGQNSMMVSSDSDSDSDEEDALDKELFGSAVKPLTRTNQFQKIAPTGPVRKVKQIRSQKDMRARLAPDLSNLHKTILGWDFFADSELPPDSAKDDYTLVTNTFKTALDYQKTFEPLLVLEAWQSFRSAREDGSMKRFEIKIANQLIVDSFVEVSTNMPLADKKELGVNIADVVLLSKSGTAESGGDKLYCLARVKEISRKRGELEIVFRMKAASNPLRPILSKGAVIWGMNILSLTPLEREYGALMALPYYDLCDEIIRAKPSPLLDYPEKELSAFVETYNVNKAQAKAVKSAIDNDAFTLIQGPPGSGKTKTICALVGAMMSGSFKPSTASAVPSRLAAGNGRPPPLAPAVRKVLVCAPSNAAVDELVMRFKAGVKTMNGSTEKLTVVRLGRSEAINANVKDVTLEELVNARLSSAAPRDGPKEDIHDVMLEHKKTCDQFNTLRDEVSSVRSQGQAVTTALEAQLDGLRRKKTLLGEKIDTIREKQNTAARDAELNRRRAQQEVIDSAHVLCATLSGSGHDIFQGLNIEFETVIIDEAAQSIELSALIPLKYGCSKCILVGDPKQLPPTVLSREAARFQYEQSLFARMEKNHQKDVHLLDTQYRMHPEISLFPSRMFYDGRLKDGSGMAELRARPWHHSSILAPYRFFDVEGMSQAASKGHSLVNIAEINVAMQLYDRLLTDVKKYDFSGKIGIITPYKGQLKALKTHFSNRFGQSILSRVEFNTTDAFQGRESEVIIFSCVRASTKGIGFLNDVRRMNVGLTRAKCSLWVLGNSQALVQGEFWRGLVTDSKARNLYTDGNITELLRRPLLTDDMMKDDEDMMDIDGEAAFKTRKPSVPNSLSSHSMSRQSSAQSSGDSIVLSGEAKTAAKKANSANSATTQPSSTGSRSSFTPSTSRPVAKTTVTIEANAREALSDVKPEIHSQSLQDDALPVMARGPSGGGNGLNDRAVCNICGSNSHFSVNCDNAAARAASLGTCRRCGVAGHAVNSCSTPRCIECGEIGHGCDSCKVPLHQRLKGPEKERVKQQEIDFAVMRDKAREKRVERQLGEHAARIPGVRSTLPMNTGKRVEGHEMKRKRDEKGSVDTHRGPKAIRMSAGLESKSDGSSSLTSAGHGRTGEPRKGPSADANGTAGLPRRPVPVVAAPTVKRKKPRDDDMFMKKR